MSGSAGSVTGPGAAETLSEATMARTLETRLVALNGSAGVPPNGSCLAAVPGSVVADSVAGAAALRRRRSGHSAPQPR